MANIEAVNHLGLPQEVFEMVLLHLDYKDVLSCSLVCVGWRNAANSNRVWLSLCEQARITALTPPLENSHVANVLEQGGNEDTLTNLTPLCFERRRFEYLIRFKKNWRAGKYTAVCTDLRKFQTGEPGSDVLLEYLDGNVINIRHIPNITPLELRHLCTDLSSNADESLYCAHNICDRNNSSVDENRTLKRILNSRQNYSDSRYYGYFNHRAHERQYPAFLKLVNSVLVVVHHTNLLQVFTKDHGGYSRKLVALFDADHSFQVPDHYDISAWYRANCHDCTRFPSRCQRESCPVDCKLKTRCDHDGKYFVGSVCNTMRGLLPHISNRQFHVWDLQSFTKINVVEVPEVEPRISIQNILFFSLPNHVIGLYLTVFDHSTFLECQRVCCYNLENMRYSSAVISCPLYAEGPGEKYGDYYHDRSGRNIIGGREPIVLFTETMVILSESGKTYLSLFDLAEGRLLAEVRKPILEMDYNNYLSYTPCSTLKVFGNHLVFGGEIHFRKYPFVTVYNLSELQEVERFAVEGSVILSLHIHMDDLMIIGTGWKGWVGKEKLWSGEQGCMHIRDMKTKNFLCKLPYIEFIPPNPFSNQMLARDTRDGVWDLLNFW